MKPSRTRSAFFMLFLAASLAAPTLAQVTAPDGQPDTGAPSAESIRFYLEQVERRQRAIADQHEQMKVKALSQAQYLKENHAAIRQKTIESQAALVAHYEMLQKQALEQARELEDNDKALFQQALQAHQQQARQHVALREQAIKRAKTAQNLLGEFEKLASDKQKEFLKDRERQLRALESPPQLSSGERESESAP